MSGFLLAQIVGMALVLLHVGRVGDGRDMLAGMVVAGQWALEIASSDYPQVAAAVFLACLFLFVAYSTRALGALLGIVSGILCVVACLTWLGAIPNERGAGIAPNYHHYVALGVWLQIGALAWLAGRDDVELA